MGQKVNPIGMRIGIHRTWDSKWYADRKKNYAALLYEDIRIRRYIMNKLRSAAVSKVVIERPVSNPRVIIHTARPGMVIGKKGADIDKIESDLNNIIGEKVSLNIVEVRKPETNAVLIASGIAMQLEKRVSFRRAVKRSIQTAMRFGVKGIKVSCAGRLGGVEIARNEWYKEGRIPLHTLRADIDYGTAEAHTTYGVIGIKVLVYKGEVSDDEKR